MILKGSCLTDINFALRPHRMAQLADFMHYQVHAAIPAVAAHA